MGASRTTNKDLAEKLDTLIDVLTAQAMPQAPVIVADAAPSTDGVEVVELDKAYLAHVTAKVTAHQKEKGGEFVLYTRKNKAGEMKLAYAARERYDAQVINQPSHIGAVATFSG